MRELMVAASLSLMAVLPGCATAPGDPKAQSEPRYYVTGSNVGRRADQLDASPVMTMSGEEMRKRRSEIVDLTSPSPKGD